MAVAVGVVETPPKFVEHPLSNRAPARPATPATSERDRELVFTEISLRPEGASPGTHDVAFMEWRVLGIEIQPGARHLISDEITFTL